MISSFEDPVREVKSAPKLTVMPNDEELDGESEFKDDSSHKEDTTLVTASKTLDASYEDDSTGTDMVFAESPNSHSRNESTLRGKEF